MTHQPRYLLTFSYASGRSFAHTFYMLDWAQRAYADLANVSSKLLIDCQTMKPVAKFNAEYL